MTIETAAPAAESAPAPVLETKELTQTLSDNPDLKDALSALKDAEKKETTTETPAPAEAPKVEEKPKEDDRFAKRFAELSKRERDLVRREQESKEREKRFSDLEKKIKEAEDDPLAFLEAHNLSYDKITELILSGHKKDPALKKLELEIKAEREARQKEKEESDRLKASQALESFKSEREAKVKEAGEKYQLVNALGEFNLVHEVTQEHFNETKDENGVGKVLSIDEAAQLVEDYLEKQIEKLKDAPKLKKILGLIQKESEPAKDETKASTVSKSTTLSNDMAQDATEPSGAFLSDEESIQKAARLLKWND